MASVLFQYGFFVAGGVLVFADNSLLYLNQSVPPYGVSVNSIAEQCSSFPLRKSLLLHVQKQTSHSVEDACLPACGSPSMWCHETSLAAPMSGQTDWPFNVWFATFKWTDFLMCDLPHQHDTHASLLLSMYLRWRFCTLYLLTCQRGVTVGDSGCCWALINSLVVIQLLLCLMWIVWTASSFFI